VGLVPFAFGATPQLIRIGIKRFRAEQAQSCAVVGSLGGWPSLAISRRWRLLPETDNRPLVEDRKHLIGGGVCARAARGRSVLGRVEIKLGSLAGPIGDIERFGMHRQRLCRGRVSRRDRRGAVGATALLLSQAASRSACDPALQFKRGSFGSLSVIDCL
jgi:hypothetical protein